jgi:hypothetical protein
MPKIGGLSATAIEVYQEKAYDLLADKNPLTVGSQNAGRKIGNDSSYGASYNGVHPKQCRCSTCWKAQKEELAARLAKRDAI